MNRSHCFESRTVDKLILVHVASLFALCSIAPGDEHSPQDIEFFETKVRPLLVEHCHKCHSAKAKKLQAGLQLDSRESILKGGDSGAAVVPEKPDESLLIQAVRFEANEMPPNGKLSETQIAALVKWVEIGAPWPTGSEAPHLATESSYDWDALREHWAFQPVKEHQPPAVKNVNWPRSPIDHFVLARLEKASMKPALPADKRTLLRRAYFDLIGLPPSPEEVDAFVKDQSEQAFEKVVDHLLDSPHYGERWGRHWLDVARYSDGLGGFLDNARLPQAWRYRDWVVDALNRDLPYDHFVRLQIAGDLMDGGRDAAATGFFALGPTYRSDGGDPDSTAKAKSETLDDRVDTLSRGFFALTVSCARCHDHKFDPIPTLDYYSLAGVFNNTSVHARPMATTEEVDRYNKAQQAIAAIQKNINILNTVAKKQNRKLNEDEQREHKKLASELEQLRKTAPAKYATMHALHETGNNDMNVALRGDLRKPGEIAPRRFLRILAGEDPRKFTRGSGRVELAEAIVDRENPLTARVIVNRLWQHHFGQGLVRTPSNFGTLGEPATHPKLLDWLADSLVNNVSSAKSEIRKPQTIWSLKSLHRTIMLSTTYQMSSQFNEQSFSADGDNRLLWRMNPRRLEVEAWRDALLTVTGELDRQVGGPSVDNIIASKRRTIYTVVSRNGDQFASDEFLRLFDFPSARSTSEGRSVTTVPQQYLFMMNNPFMIERAKALSSRLTREASDDASRIDRAYWLLYSRPPTEVEVKLGLQSLVAPAEIQRDSRLSKWEQYAQVLLSSNELMYVR